MYLFRGIARNAGPWPPHVCDSSTGNQCLAALVTATSPYLFSRAAFALVLAIVALITPPARVAAVPDNQLD